MNHLNITLAGRKDDPYLLKCKAALTYIKSKNNAISSTELPLFETEWEEYLSKLQQTYGGRFLGHKSSPLIFFNESQYIGGANEFLVFADAHYNYKDTTDISKYVEQCEKALQKLYIENTKRRYCYMDVKVDDDARTKTQAEKLLNTMRRNP